MYSSDSGKCGGYIEGMKTIKLYTTIALKQHRLTSPAAVTQQPFMISKYKKFCDPHVVSYPSKVIFFRTLDKVTFL